jgi:tricorn protease
MRSSGSTIRTGRSLHCRWERFPILLVALAIPAALSASHATAGNEPSAPTPDEIILPRHPAPSPDGRQIAFSYQGDIWIVASTGGEARRLTAHPAYDAHPVWSPDGAWIAFASDRDGNDDVYAIPVAGGELRRLTWHSDGDIPTDWTPDSRAVIFSSRRHIRDGDNAGAFLVPLDGGTPRPIVPVGAASAVVSPDGTRLAFVRGSLNWWRRGYEGNARGRLWLLDMERRLRFPGTSGSGDPGDSGAPGSGGESPATSAALCAAAALVPGGRYTNLTALGLEPSPPPPAGQPQKSWATIRGAAPDWAHPALEPGVSTDPAWFPDGQHLLYLSEYHGVANLKVIDIRDGRRAWVTHFTEGRLRFPALSRDGRTAAFEYEDGIYVVRLPAALPPGGSSEWPAPVPAPQRLAIRLPIDEKAQPIERVDVSGGADEIALSPDNEQIALVCAGEIFAMKASEDEPYAYDISQSTARDWQVTWAPDSKSLVFVSDRGGNQDLYRVSPADTSESRLARSLRVKIERLTDDPSEEWRPKFSPDGERMAYLRGNGTLMVMKPDGTDARLLADGFSDIEFVWSPDSRWIAYTQEDSDFNRDVFIVGADGSQGPHNISQHPCEDYAPAWSPDGRMLAFVSSREFLNQVDVWYVWLTRADEELSKEQRLDALSGGGEKEKKGKEAEGKKKDEEAEPKLAVRIDFEDIHKRLHRLTTFPGSETSVLISKDASELVFVSNTDGKTDLWKIKWDGSEPKRLTDGGQEPYFVQWDKKSERLFYLKKGGQIASVSLKGGDAKSYPFKSEVKVERRAQRAFVFDEGWRALRDRYYDERMHGCDWPAAREHYRPWALATPSYRDFQDVFRMMMGEINSSHLGLWGGPGDPSLDEGPRAQAGELGVLFDAHDTGAGLLVVHVVKNSPAARLESRLAVGDRIVAVNGTPVTPVTDIARLLDRTVEKPVWLEVVGADGKPREVTIRPIAFSAWRGLLYDEEIEARRARVRELSGGSVAYLHVAGMSEESLDLFERDLYAEAHGKEAIVIDVRDNGGGWTTDLLLTSLMAADHATTIARGGGSGYPTERRLLYAWTQPIAVICDEYSFSNAEIFSWSIRAMKRGPVVGQQTNGGVISTGGTDLLDGSFVRLPFRTWFSKLDGSEMEGTGCRPDIPVENRPGDLVRGVDAQLDRAVEEARRQAGR